MNNILNWLRNKFGSLSMDAPSDHKTHDVHHVHRDGLFLTKQQLNRTTVLLLLTSLFIFVGGYFWGQHTAAEQLLTMVERDSFADQVYYAMTANNEHNEEEAADDEPQTQVADAAAPATVNVEPAVNVAQAAAQPTEPIASQETQPHVYKGILAGFSTEKAAQQMSQRLKRRGFDVDIITRHSQTKHGRSIAWYQAVTAPMADRMKLEQVVAQIKKFEKLHDVSIAAIS